MEMNPKEIIDQFDQFLASKQIRFSGVVIGGSALVLMGTIQRPTEDVDILSPPIPLEIQKLAEEFRSELKKRGTVIGENWFNNGPDTLLNALPKDWGNRTKTIYSGKALSLSTLGRIELLQSKLWAFCDRREADRNDLLEMKPSLDELRKCLPWVQEQDANTDWPLYVESQFKKLARDLGYEL